MQSQQQQNQAQKHNKKESKSFKIPPIIVSYQDYVPTRMSIGEMRTTSINGTSQFTGSFENPLNNDAMQMMGISERSILEALNYKHSTQLGRVSNVHFKDPAGELGDYFARYGLKPVVARWRPTRIEIFDIKVQGMFIAQKFYTNHLDRQVSYTAELTSQVKESTTSGWSREFSQSLGKSAYAGVDIKFVSAGVSIETTATTAIGQNQTFTRQVTLGSTSKVEVPVRAFESIRVVLNASLGTAKARVTYEVQLDGWLVAYGRDGNSHTTLHYHSAGFPFNTRATVEQVLQIGNYGSDYIQTFPWTPPVQK